MSNLGCECGVCFLNTLEARIVNMCDRPKKLPPRFDLLGGFIGCIENLV